MLAVFLVSVGVIAALKLLTTGINYSIDSRNQFVASLLAQEGVELVRNVRDNNWIDNDPTTKSFDDSKSCLSQSRANYYIDYSGNYDCGGSIPSNKYKLCLNSDNFYENNVGGGANCTSGSATRFSRRIYNFNDLNYTIITSVAIWGDDWPSCSSTNLSNPICLESLKACNTISKCAYAQVTLNKWGE